MEATEQQDGTSASAAAQVAEDEGDGPSCAATAPPPPQSAAEVARIVQALGEEDAGSATGVAGGGSEQVASAHGEEGAIARGKHLATGDMRVDDD